VQENVAVNSPRGVGALKRGRPAYVSMEVLLMTRGSTTTSTWLGGVG